MLKLINIPNIVYDWLANGFPNEDDVEHILEILRGGITIPDNATNGDVIKTMFPKILYIETVIDEYTNKPTFVMLKDGDRILTNFSMEWWNSLYQKGGTT